MARSITAVPAWSISALGVAHSSNPEGAELLRSAGQPVRSGIGPGTLATPACSARLDACLPAPPADFREIILDQLGLPAREVAICGLALLGYAGPAAVRNRFVIGRVLPRDNFRRIRMNAKRTRPSHGRARAAARLARTAAAIGSSVPLGLRLRAARSLLMVVDVHERLLPTIDQVDRVVAQCAALMKMAKLLAVPVLVTEHVPDKLGPTTPALRTLVADHQVAAKRYFCAADEPTITQRVAALNRPQLVIVGFEAHVCVLQTALGFAERGYRVHVVADACGSRTEEARAVAMDRLRAAQVSVVTAEMVMFEWLEHADRAEMRDLIALIK